MTKDNDIDAYIFGQSAELQKPLLEVRSAIQAALPDALEVISYGIPTYRLNDKNVIHFGAGKHHVGLYATPDGHAAFEPELSKYKRGKGSVQFPLDQPMPLDLIKRIAKYRAEQVTQ